MALLMVAPPKRYTPLTALQVSGRICEYCLTPPKEDKSLWRCTGCRRVAYCNSKCQKADWKGLGAHKKLCQQLRKVNEMDKCMDKAVRFTSEEYLNQQDKRSALLTQSSFPGEYVQHQIKCEVCFHTPFTKPEVSEFRHCARCELVWWCSPQCKAEFDRTHTQEHCDQLFLVHCVDRLKIDYAIARNSSKALMIHGLQPRPTYVPLSSLSGWADYHHHIFPEFDHAAEFTSREFAELNKDVELATRTRAMEALSLPLTVLAALEHALPDLHTRTTLRVHFAGVGAREMRSRGMTEELLHLLPCLRSLHVSFVGPHMDVDPGISRNLACEPCAARGGVREMTFSRRRYEFFARRVEKPDLIVGLNTGMTESDTASWRRAIDAVLRGGAPAVFTAYTQVEAETEERWLRQLGARITKGVEINKWRGVVPTINTYFSGGHIGGEPLYHSHYWYMIEGRV